MESSGGSNAFKDEWWDPKFIGGSVSLVTRLRVKKFKETFIGIQESNK